MDTDGDGTVSLEELINYTVRYPELIQPAVELQGTLKKDLFGNGFWKKLTKSRQKRYGKETPVEEILLSLRKQMLKKRGDDAALKAIEEERIAKEEEEKNRIESEKAEEQAQEE